MCCLIYFLFNKTPFTNQDDLSENMNSISEDPLVEASSDTSISESDMDEDQSYLGYKYDNKSMDDYFSTSSSSTSVSYITDDTMGTCDFTSASSGNTSPRLFSNCISKPNGANMNLTYQQNHDNIIDLDSYLVNSTTKNRYPIETDPNLAYETKALIRAKIDQLDKHRRHSYHHCRNGTNNLNHNDTVSLTSASISRLDKNGSKLSVIDSSYPLNVPASTYQSIPCLDPVLSNGSLDDTASDSLVISDDDISNEIEKSSIDTLLHPGNAESEAIMNSGYDPYFTYGQLQVNGNLMNNSEEVDLSSW